MDTIPKRSGGANHAEWLATLTALRLHEGDADVRFIQRARSSALRLGPMGLIAELRRLLNAPRPWIFAEQMPIDDELPSIARTGPIRASTPIGSAALIGIVCAADYEPFGYDQEQCGTLVHHVAPQPGPDGRTMLYGDGDLGFHTDGAVFEEGHRPEVLFLLALRNDGGTRTSVASIDEAMLRLSESSRRILAEPRFIIPVPGSFALPALRGSRRGLVTIDAGGTHRFAGNLHRVEALDADADAALRRLVDALEAVKSEYVLRPGNLLAMDNTRCLHARNRVVGERWLLRIYARRSLAALRRTDNSRRTRVFDAESLLAERAERTTGG